MHTLLLSLVLSAPGDVVWVGPPSVDMEVTPTEKVLIGTAVKNAFGVPAAKIDFEGCHQNIKEQMATVPQVVAWSCTVGGDVTLTDDQFWTADLAGVLKDPSAGTLVKKANTLLTLGQMVDHEAVTQALWAEPLTAVYGFRFWRDPEISTKIWARMWPIVQGTTTQYRAARVAKQVTFPVAEVP